jgi:hypothetical protein
MFSLINVGGFNIDVSFEEVKISRPRNKFIEGRIDLPAIVIEDEAELEVQLKSVYDVMWQAAGWEESPNYFARIEELKNKNLL